jgi:hypothetical protein
MMLEVDPKKQVGNKYMNGKELMHLSKASEITQSGRFMSYTDGTYELADKDKNKDCLIF